jgi:hypothetical protein
MERHRALGDSEKKIAGVESFDELYAAIRSIGPVEGTCLMWTPAELIDRIEGFRSVFAFRALENPVLLKLSKAGMDDLVYNARITRSLGIAAKVGELVLKANRKQAD